jgi:NAD+ synthase (glutamine-hydrolysing)
MLRDIGHPSATGKPVYDVTFENVQAGERTSHLFRLANLHQALVLGTSDLSELALGWCTYGVGDHMSHYAINASVPKTLMQFLIRWVAETNQLGEQSSRVLRAILETDFSPELIPAENDEEPFAQKTGFHSLLYDPLWIHALQDCVFIILFLEKSGSGALARCSGA